MTTLDGEIVLVTGASRGISQAVARELGRRGATVIGTATTRAGAEAIDRDLRDLDLGGAACVWTSPIRQPWTRHSRR